jgi:hypothetical protein
LRDAPGNGPDYGGGFAAGLLLDQIDAGKGLLDRAGAFAAVTIGNPADVLSPAGNVSDIACTNLLWYLNLLQVEGIDLPEGRNLPGWGLTEPAESDKAAVAFLDRYRNTDTANQALERLQEVNGLIALSIQSIVFEDVGTDKVSMAFYGEQLPCHIVAGMISHGFHHLGQADGKLKSLKAGAAAWDAPEVPTP